MVELWSAREPFGNLSHFGPTTLTSTSKAEKVWSTSINIFQNFSNSSSQTEGGFHPWSDIWYNFRLALCWGKLRKGREEEKVVSLGRSPVFPPSLWLFALGVASCAVKCNPVFFPYIVSLSPKPSLFLRFRHSQVVIAGDHLKLPHGVQERLWPAVAVSQMDWWSPPAAVLH